MNRFVLPVCFALGLACGSPSATDGGSGGGAGGGGGGGGGAGGGGAADAGRIDDVCGTICTTLDQCDPSDGGSSCLGSCQSLVAPFRDEYSQALARCHVDTACGDLFQTTTDCPDGGFGASDGGVHSCTSSSVDVCFAAAGNDVPATVLEPFYTTVCPKLVSCGTSTDDAQCRSTLGASMLVAALKAYPDAAINCTATCLQGQACGALSSAMLESALNDCASKTCGIHLSH